MRVKKIVKIIFLNFLIWTLCFSWFLPPQKALAANVNFSQSILPVRFVYINNQGNIEKIWSNISEKDDLYVVKCIDAKSQKEVSMNDKLLMSYQDMVKKSGTVSGTIFPDVTRNYFSQKDNYSVAVDFLKFNNYVEEVRTYS